MRKRWQMIGLLSINHSVKTKDKKTPGRRGEWTESSGHFYGRLRAVQGIRGLSYTGGSGANGLKQKEMNFQFHELTLFFSTDHVYKLWECEMGNTHPGHLYFRKTDRTCDPDCDRSY